MVSEMNSSLGLSDHTKCWGRDLDLLGKGTEGDTRNLSLCWLKIVSNLYYNTRIWSICDFNLISWWHTRSYPTDDVLTHILSVLSTLKVLLYV